MADDFDPLKNEAGKSYQGSNPQKELNKSNSNNQSHRPSDNSLWKRSSTNHADNQISSSDVQASQAGASRELSEANTPKAPSSNVVNSIPSRSASTREQPQVHIIEQKPKPYWESGENSFENSSQDQSEGENYAAEQASAYSQERLYNHGKPYRKKSLSGKIDRLVQRIPALNKFYKQPPSSPDKYEIPQGFKYDQTSHLAYNNQAARELTADDLALNERYSDKTCVQLISLEAKDRTQPVDVCIHHGTNKIYLCDIGRSLVEIYDMNKTLQHVVDNPTMIKFQPTAIAVAFDGTIIIASHFSHYLHMYTPSDPHNETNPYSYKQFRLGVEGSQLHQFYQPAGISVDSNDGYLYVCDRGNYRIQVFTPDGICERAIELLINDKKHYRLDPVRIALQKQSDQMICLVGTGDAICFIPKYANGQIYVDPFYVLDENGLGIENAAGLAVDAQDRIFISDTSHNRIVICTSDGSYITSFGTEGDGPGQLKRPCGLDITNDGTVVVADPGNKRLQLFGVIHKESSIRNDPPNDKPNEINNASSNKEHDSASML